VLIFTRTKHRARRLVKQIARSGYKVTGLHSDRTQNQRRSALEGFKQGKFQIMVATDIAARGLDIDRISHVINFDMPDTADAYIHRIGRTGRAKRTGEAFTLVTPDDHAMVRKIEKVMKQKLIQKTLPDFDYAVPKPEYPQTARKPMPPKKRTSSSRPKQHTHRPRQTTGSGIG
jgi:ATP-dependent RNA helicase RhlE